MGFTYAVIDRELGEQTFGVGSPCPTRKTPACGRRWNCDGKLTRTFASVIEGVTPCFNVRCRFSSWSFFACLPPRMGRRTGAGDSGQSAYQIVLADNASPSTKHGAEELQMFLQEMTGAKLPIVSDRQPQGPKEIMLGDNAHLQKLGVPIDFAALGQEG